MLESRRARLTRGATRRLLGVPQADVRNPLDLDDYKFPFPILGCLCVHDSPDSPCPCGVLVWMIDRPVAVSKSGRKSAAGEDLLAFSLAKDAQVALEIYCPVDIVDLDRIMAWARGQKAGGSGVSYAPPLDWLSLAGAIGYGIGTVLDDLAGSGEGGNDNLSDDISDWAAENFPAPDWLQDIFD